MRYYVHQFKGIYYAYDFVTKAVIAQARSVDYLLCLICHKGYNRWVHEA
jgi:hypothetical protein